MATAAQMARGSGSCLCSEASFYGMDEQGRSTCAEGTCPAGTEEKDGICRSCPAGTYSLAGGICKKCGPGTKSSESSSSCLKCSPGRISQGSGNSVCEECPAGKYEISRQWCNDCPPGSLSPSGSNACTKCPGGFFTAVHGSSMCDSCHARVEHMPKRAVPSALCVLQAQFQAAGVGTVATALPAILPKTQWRVKPVEVELSPWEEAVAAVLQVMSQVLQAQFARAAMVF